MTHKIKQTIGRFTTIALILASVCILASISSSSADRAIKCQKEGKCISTTTK